MADGRDDCIAMAAKAIRDALGQAAEPSATDTARALIAAGKRVDAVKLFAEQDGLSLTEAKARVDGLTRSPER